MGRCQSGRKDLPDVLNSNVKLFTGNASLFPVVHNITDTASLELSKINKWALQWKMIFNPDPTKPAQEIIFQSQIVKEKSPKP